MGRIHHTYATLCLDFDLFHNANQQTYPAARETAEGLQTKVRMIPQLLKASKMMFYSPPLPTDLIFGLVTYTHSMRKENMGQNHIDLVSLFYFLPS